MAEPMRQQYADPGERISALDERVAGLSSRQVHLEQVVAKGFASIETKMGEIQSSVAAGQRTPWQVIVTAIGVGAALVGGIYGLSVGPMRETDAQLRDADDALRAAIVELSKEVPSRAEIDYRAERSREDRDRLQSDLAALRAEVVPRGEHQEQWRSNSEAMTGLQRQIDQVREAVMEMRERLDRIERRGGMP